MWQQTISQNTKLIYDEDYNEQTDIQTITHTGNDASLKSLVPHKFVSTQLNELLDIFDLI